MNRQMATEKKEPISEEQTRFTKEQIVGSEKFRGQRDLLNALLSDEKSYTAGEVRALADNYLKGMVK